ncbi:2409_t:CDS:2 [Acaulospora colombiana]|uniref:2409_t:CDS:1 n=1 Tax=Acaulospora colombiana TaxID=27376 RepID=A0ACA9L9V3_9GLOM|nr:2409_t:CDS:2 [Acaulospora colombiana]
MKPKNIFEDILKTSQQEFDDDYEEIIMDGSTPTGFYDYIYEGINAPRYRDFLNDMTVGEGDSWFDMQNNTFEISPISTEVSVLNLEEKKTTETSTKTTERPPPSSKIDFCHVNTQDKRDGSKKIDDISEPKADAEKVKAKAIRIKVNKNNHKHGFESNDLSRRKESHVVTSEMKPRRTVENNAETNTIDPMPNIVSRVAVNSESSHRTLNNNMNTKLNQGSKVSAANVTPKKRIDEAWMTRNIEVHQNIEDSVDGITSKIVISPAVKHITVPEKIELSKHNELPKRNKDYPTSRSPGIKKRQPAKRFRAELTVPKPFIFRAIPHMQMNERRPTRSPFISLAERVKHFLEDTPERFKTKLVSLKPTNTVHTRLLTVPKSPYLRTKQRAKMCKVTSNEDQKFDSKSRMMPKDVENNCDGKSAVPIARKTNVTIPRSQRPTQHHKAKPCYISHSSKESHRLIGSTSETEEKVAKIRQNSQERDKAFRVKSDSSHPSSVTEQKFVKKKQLEKENIKLSAKAKVPTKKSEKQLTEPIGFVFQTDSRIQLRKARDQNEELLKKKKWKEEEIRNQRKTNHLRTELTNNPHMAKNFSSRAQPPKTKAKKKFSKKQVIRQ